MATRLESIRPLVLVPQAAASSSIASDETVQLRKASHVQEVDRLLRQVNLAKLKAVTHDPSRNGSAPLLIDD